MSSINNYERDCAYDYLTGKMDNATSSELGDMVKFIDSGFTFKIMKFDNGKFSDLIAALEAAKEIIESDIRDINEECKKKMDEDSYRGLRVDMRWLNIKLANTKQKISNLVKRQREAEINRRIVVAIKKMNPEIVEKASEFVLLMED